MYGRSATAATNMQKIAQAEALRRWGDGPAGHEVIAHPVCKGKFQPWRGSERQYGCFRHHAIRKRRIDKAGLRPGWESFEQWALPAAVSEDANPNAADGACGLARGSS